jgi:hypothetical protein
LSEKLPPDAAAIYDPITLLGAGGYGDVWLARHRQLDREAAVKVLRGSHAADAGEVQRFLAEAKITASLAHPAIVKVFDFGFQPGYVPWIAYERLEGRTLAQAIERGPLAAPAALTACARVAEALQHAHEHGVVHRDVKPANIFDVGGDHRVTDFGVARWAGAARVQTAAGTLIGSPPYMAPEMIMGEPVSPATDIYALGVTLYQLLTGRLPYEAPHLVALLELHGTQAVPRPSARRSELSPPVDEVVLKALAKRPEDRFASAAEMAQTLGEVAAMSTGGYRRFDAGGPTRAMAAVQAPHAPGVPVHALRPHAMLAGALLLSAAVGAAFTALVLRPGPPAPAPSPTPVASIPAPPTGPRVRVMELVVIPGSISALFHVRTNPPTPMRLTLRPGHLPPMERLPSADAPRVHHLELRGLKPETSYLADLEFPGREGGLRAIPLRTVSHTLTARVEKSLATEEALGGDDLLISVLDDLQFTLTHVPEARIVAKLRGRDLSPVAFQVSCSVAMRWRSATLFDHLLPTPQMAMLPLGERITIASWASSSGYTRPLAAVEKYLVAPVELTAPELTGLVVAIGSGPDPEVSQRRLDTLLARVPAPASQPVARQLVELDRAGARTRFESWLARRADDDARRLALIGLAALGEPHDVERIAEELAPDRPPRRRADAAHLLGTLPVARASDALLAALRETSPPADAVWAAGRLGLAQAVPRLLELARAGPAPLAEPAVLALGLICGRPEGGPVPERLEPVASMLREASKNSARDLRRAAAWALGALRDEGGAPALRACWVADPAPVVLWALGECGAADLTEQVLRERATARADRRDLELAVHAARRAISLAEFRRITTALRERLAPVSTTLTELSSGAPADPREAVAMVFPLVPWTRFRPALRVEPGDLIEAQAAGAFRLGAGDDVRLACEPAPLPGDRFALVAGLLAPHTQLFAEKPTLHPINEPCEVLATAFRTVTFGTASELPRQDLSGWVRVKLRMLSR